MAERYTGRTLREIVRVVAGRFVGMVVIFVVVVAAVLAATFYAPKWYRSEVQLQAKPSVLAGPLETQVRATLRDQVSLFVVTQRQIIKSNYVLASALMCLDAGEKGSALKQFSDDDVYRFVRDNAERVRVLKKRVEVVTPGGPDADFTQTFTVRVNWPEQRDSVPGGASTEATAVRRAHDLAGYIVDAYKVRYARLESERTRDQAKFLTEKVLVAAGDKLDKASADLEKFVKDEVGEDLLLIKNLIGRRTGGVETGVASLTTQFQAEINNADAQLKESAALKKVIDDELAKGKSNPAVVVVPDAVVASNPTVATLESKIMALKLRLNALEPRFTKDYQEVTSVRAELASARLDLYRELEKQSVRLSQQMDVVTARRDTLKAKVEANRQREGELAGKAAKYERLADARDAAQVLYDAEQKRLHESVMAEMFAADPMVVTVLDMASMPDPARPRMPILWLNLLIACAGGLIIALVYAFLADHFDHTIKSIDDAERYLGVPVLSSVPRLGRNIIRTR